MLRRARPADLDEVVQLVREFYEVDRHPFDEAHVRGALPALLDDDRYGAVWLLEGPAGPSGPSVGYAVVTWGYSIESGGREGLLDEVFVRERGRGTGRRALAAVVEACRAEGVRRLFLETEAGNVDARRFYARNGFEVDDSVWMSRWL